jgi:hypothetical protein
MTKRIFVLSVFFTNPFFSHDGIYFTAKFFFRITVFLKRAFLRYPCNERDYDCY